MNALPPAQERDRSAGPAMTITTGRVCLACGYSLRGLPVNGRCPECGLPAAPLANIDDPLSMMPKGVIDVFRRGTLVGSACTLFAACGVMFWMFRASPRSLMAIAIIMLAIGWCAAAWMMTPALDLPQAIIRGFTARSWLRAAARALQFGWVIAAVGLLVMQAIGARAPMDQILLRIVQFGLGTGLIGIVVLAILLERLAEWVRDDYAERAFNLAVWCLLLGVMVPLALMEAGWFVGWSNLGLLIGCVLGLLAFPTAMLSLGRSVALAAHHSVEYQERLARRRARQEQEGAEMAARIRAAEAARRSSATR
jgi:hypothetical protein